METRRDFIKKGFALGVAFSLGTLGGLFAAENDSKTVPAGTAGSGNSPKIPDLVAVRGGSRVAMLERALQELGGIEAFVKKGQTVVIKPNIGWDVIPARSANTHPDIVGRLVELCIKAGAKRVDVFDHTCDVWEKCYSSSGIAEAVKAAGGNIVPGNDEKLYREVKIQGAKKLTSAKVHELILDDDVFIDVPVLKHHSGATMTCAMKNYMGLIWDRGFYHRNDLHQCICDSLRIRKPDLIIVDADTPMLRNGPRGKSEEDLIATNALIASRDAVAADAASSMMLGHKQDGIGHVKLAAAEGLGVCDLKSLNISRIAMK